MFTPYVPLLPPTVIKDPRSQKRPTDSQRQASRGAAEACQARDPPSHRTRVNAADKKPVPSTWILPAIRLSMCSAPTFFA